VGNSPAHGVIHEEVDGEIHEVDKVVQKEILQLHEEEMVLYDGGILEVKGSFVLHEEEKED
jgi:hypothetical protein